MTRLVVLVLTTSWTVRDGFVSAGIDANRIAVAQSSDATDRERKANRGVSIGVVLGEWKRLKKAPSSCHANGPLKWLAKS